MKVSSSWLKDHLRRTMFTDDMIVSSLDRAGIEIEQVLSSKTIDKKIIICLVKNVVQHPGADRLKIAEIETGEGIYRVVCGAPNVRPGIKVPYAQIGVVLPSGDVIAQVKLRGEMSDGMLCSELELGLGVNHAGLLELPSDAAVGTPLSELFPADSIIDLKTPANRFDVQSVWGLAREVAAMADAPLSDLELTLVETKPDAQVVLPDSQALPHLFVHIKLADLAPSPSWMQARLRAAGMRPISPIVDITNYVMLEYGQPLHAFDASKLSLPVTARAAKPGEQLHTLDGSLIKLSVDDLVIADTTGPIALAGVMGGASTEVDQNTTAIWLEAAVFDGVRVRKTAKRHGLRTEASARYERGLPAQLPALGVARAVQLFGENHKGRVIQAVEAKSVVSDSRLITVQFVQISKTLGFDITPAEVRNSLKRLEFTFNREEADSFTVEVPWWRPDVTLPIDLIEEVVRVIGYHRVPSTIPSWRPAQLQFDTVRAKRRLVRDGLFAAGLFEVMTYSFVSEEQLHQTGLDPKKHLKLKNPLSVEQAYLRSTLLASHLAVAERNRTYAKQFGLYEISQVFLEQPKGELPLEPLRLAITQMSPAAAYKKVKGILDLLVIDLNVNVIIQPKDEPEYAPGRAGLIVLGGKPIGKIGQLRPDLVKGRKLSGEAAYLELDLNPLLAASEPRAFAGLRRFPVISRDITLQVPVAVTWHDVNRVLEAYEVQYLDEYSGAGVPEGLRGLTLRLTLAEPDRTPTEAEANEITAKALKLLERKLGIVPRVAE